MKDCFQFIAKNIRKLRKIKGFTQERLAEEADISVTHYYYRFFFRGWQYKNVLNTELPMRVKHC